MKLVKQSNIVVIRYKYLLLGFMVIGSYLISLLILENVEQSWALMNGTTSLFQSNSFIENLLWLFVFAASGYEDGIFPQSPVGKFIVSLVPILALSGSLAIVGVLARDQVKNQFLNRTGMNTSHKKNHIIICGWNKKHSFVD